MRIRTVFVAAVLAAVAALPLAALPFAGVASAAGPVRDCHGFSGRTAACEEHVGRHRFVVTRLDAPDPGDSATAPGDTGALVLAGLGAVAALGAAYGVVRRSPGRPRLRSR